MTQEHPITPPPHLIEQWMQDHSTKYALSRQAAQWGADQELDACCEWLMLNGYGAAISRLHAARRPKPPSLKELALDDLRVAFDRGCLSGIQADTIRRALEQLDD